MLKAYTERAQTAYEHAWEITEAYGYRQFNDVEADLVAWMDARAWTMGDGPRVLFGAAAAWLTERKVLLSGVSVLAVWLPGSVAWPTSGCGTPSPLC